MSRTQLISVSLTTLIAILSLSQPAKAQSTCDLNGTDSGINSSDANQGATATLPSSLACGSGATANGGIAVGTNSTATRTSFFANAISVAIGGYAKADADGAVAVGSVTNLLNVAGQYSIAIGSGAAARGENSVAIGGSGFLSSSAQSSGANSISIGSESKASASGAIALGLSTVADGTNAIAIGLGAANGGFANSVALGAGSANTATNQVAVGGQSEASARTVTGVAKGIVSATSFDAVNGSQLNTTNTQVAANAASISAIETVNTSQQGQIAANAASISAIQTVNTSQQSQIAGNAASIGAIETVNTSQQSQINTLQTVVAAMNLGSIEGQIDSLFDLRRDDRRDMKSGVAAAMAMAPAPMPSGPGKVTYSANGARFRGQNAVAGSLSYRLNTSAPVAIGAGFSFAGKKNNGIRVGVAGEF